MAKIKIWTNGVMPNGWAERKKVIECLGQITIQNNGTVNIVLPVRLGKKLMELNNENSSTDKRS